MSTESEPVRDAEVRRALEAVAAVEDPDVARALGAFAFDLVSRQAEGQTFFSGEKYIAKRLEQHGVDRADGATEAGHLVEIAERGAQDARERALVAAFAVRGLADALEGDGAEAKVFRFVRHLDWLELATPYSLSPFLDPLLGDAAGAIWKELAQAVVDDAASKDGGRAEVRARNAARLTALAESEASTAAEALRSVVRSSAMDEATRLLASTLAGDGAGESAVVSPRVSGAVGRVPRTRPLEVLRWVSGWALLSWVLRGLGFLVGVRRQAELRLGASELEVHTTWSLLGRTVREGTARWKRDALQGAGREVRYPALHLLVGAVTLSLGVLLGGLMFFDGVRSGELILLMIAAGLVLGGAALDLALDVFVPGGRGRVSMDVVLADTASIRLTRVRLDEADRFLRALKSR